MVLPGLAAPLGAADPMAPHQALDVAAADVLAREPKGFPHPSGSVASAIPRRLSQSRVAMTRRPTSRLLVVVQLDSERRLDRAAGERWFRQTAAVWICAPAVRPTRARARRRSRVPRREPVRAEAGSSRGSGGLAASRAARGSAPARDPVARPTGSSGWSLVDSQLAVWLGRLLASHVPWRRSFSARLAPGKWWAHGRPL